MTMVIFLVLCLAIASMATESPQCKIREEPDRVIADCRRKGFTTVPSDQLPPNITHLLLDHNQISTLPSSTFANLTSVVKISVQFNSLSHFSKDSLIHLPNLEHFDVSHNPIWVNESSVPSGVFSKTPFLRTLILPEGEIPSSAIAGLEYLELLQVALSATEDKPLPDVLSTLPSLKILNLSYGHIRELNSTILDPIRNSSIEVLMFVRSDIAYIEPYVFKDFLNLRSINLACNEINPYGFIDVMKAFSVLGSTPLDTLILDGVNIKTPVILRAEDFCTDIRRVKRLSIKSNSIIGVNLDAIPCFQMEVVSFGYFNTPYFTHPSVGEYELGALMASVPTHTVDLSYMVSTGPGFGNKYCNSGSPLFNDDYFPPPLESLPIVNSNITFSNGVSSTANRLTRIHPSIRYFDVNHFGTQPSTERFIFHPANLNNSLTVFNVSFTHLFTKFPVIGNLWQMQIMDVSHTGMRAITKEASESFKDYVNLRYLILSHNRLFETGSDFKDTFTYLSELLSIDLSSNGITFLHNGTFANNHNLEEILLSYNSLDDTTTLLLSSNPNLEYLDLSYNNFKYVSDGMVSELDHLTGQVVVDISHNPFVCNCDSINFIKWINKTEVSIVDDQLLMCSYHNKTVQMLHFPVNVLEKDCEKPNFDVMLKRLLLGIRLLTVFIITSMSIAYRLRWHIRWNYYSLRRYYRKKALLYRGDYAEDQCDAYVVFNQEEDTSFVFQVLRPALEGDHASSCSLYLNGRDDYPGITKSENVVDGMGKCGRVLLLVTPEFSQDEMCEFALHMGLVKGVNSVIILLKNYPGFASMTSTLRALLEPNSGVPAFEWPDENSGQRLVMAELMEAIGAQRGMQLREIN